MAIADTITSMQTHTSNAYTMIGYGTDLTGTNKNLENLSSSIFNAFLEALRTPDTLFTNLPKKSGSGSNITLNDTANAPMKIELSASELTQDGTPTPSSPQAVHSISGSNKIVVCGKNLFDVDEINKPTGVSVDSDGWITITLDNTGGASTLLKNFQTPPNIFLKTSTSYAIFLEVKSISGSGTITVNENSWRTQFYGVQSQSFSSLSANTTYKLGNVNTKDSFASTERQFTSYAYTTETGISTITFRLSILEDTSITTDNFVYTPYTLQEADIDLKSKNLIQYSKFSSQQYITNDSNDSYELTINNTTGSTIYPAITFSTPLKVDTYSTRLDVKNITFGKTCTLFVQEDTNDYTSTHSIVQAISDIGTFVASKTFNDTVKRFMLSVPANTQITLSAMLVKGTYTSSNIPDYVPYYDYGFMGSIGNYENKPIRTSGKNKLPYTKNPVNETISNVKRTGNLGIYELSGTASGGGGSAVKYELKDLYTIKDGDYLHFGNEVSNGNSTLNLFDENGSSILSYSPAPANRILSLSNYVGQTIKYIGFYNNASFTGTLILKPMILNTNTATEFEPYGSNEWYIKKNIGKVVLDGSEDWALGSVFYVLGVLPENAQGVSASKIMSNYFNNNLGGATDNYIALPGTAGSSIRNIWLKATQFATTSDLTTWLSTHNTELYYPLATPTYTQITGTLETQLENVYQKLLSYTGQTNISQVNNDLAFNMSVQAIEE